jgi:hypothetical protein
MVTKEASVINSNHALSVQTRRTGLRASAFLLFLGAFLELLALALYLLANRGGEAAFSRDPHILFNATILVAPACLIPAVFFAFSGRAARWGRRTPALMLSLLAGLTAILGALLGVFTHWLLCGYYLADPCTSTDMGTLLAASSWLSDFAVPWGIIVAPIAIIRSR